MKEKYFYIEPETARDLLAEVKGRKAEKRGFDSHVYLVGNYAVLTTGRIKLRNVTTRDDNLIFFDELIQTLWDLRAQGVAVVPILGYCYDPDSKDGTGFIFQPRAKGEELYDDAVMKEYYVWAQKNPEDVYLFSSDIDPKRYLLSRTDVISKVPQEHYDKFVRDILLLNQKDILVDFNGKSNFFYDNEAGFQFIDLDSHTDYKYGLNDSKNDDNEWALLGCFSPCHLAVGTDAFGGHALDEKQIAKLSAEELRQLELANKIIFEKCKAAVLNNGISKERLKNALEELKIFGCSL